LPLSRPSFDELFVHDHLDRAMTIADALRRAAGALASRKPPPNGFRAE